MKTEVYIEDPATGLQSRCELQARDGSAAAHLERLHTEKVLRITTYLRKAANGHDAVDFVEEVYGGPLALLVLLGKTRQPFTNVYRTCQEDKVVAVILCEEGKALAFSLPGSKQGKAVWEKLAVRVVHVHCFQEEGQERVQLVVPPPPPGGRLLRRALQDIVGQPARQAAVAEPPAQDTETLPIHQCQPLQELQVQPQSSRRQQHRHRQQGQQGKDLQQQAKQQAAASSNQRTGLPSLAAGDQENGDVHSGLLAQPAQQHLEHPQLQHGLHRTPGLQRLQKHVEFSVQPGQHEQLHRLDEQQQAALAGASAQVQQALAQGKVDGPIAQHQQESLPVQGLQQSTTQASTSATHVSDIVPGVQLQPPAPTAKLEVAANPAAVTLIAAPSDTLLHPSTTTPATRLPAALSASETDQAVQAAPVRRQAGKRGSANQDDAQQEAPEQQELHRPGKRQCREAPAQVAEPTSWKVTEVLQRLWEQLRTARLHAEAPEVVSSATGSGATQGGDGEAPPLPHDNTGTKVTIGVVLSEAAGPSSHIAPGSLTAGITRMDDGPHMGEWRVHAPFFKNLRGDVRVLLLGYYPTKTVATHLYDLAALAASQAAPLRPADRYNMLQVANLIINWFFPDPAIDVLAFGDLVDAALRNAQQRGVYVPKYEDFAWYLPIPWPFPLTQCTRLPCVAEGVGLLLPFQKLWWHARKRRLGLQEGFYQSMWPLYIPPKAAVEAELQAAREAAERVAASTDEEGQEEEAGVEGEGEAEDTAVTGAADEEAGVEGAAAGQGPQAAQVTHELSVQDGAPVPPPSAEGPCSPTSQQAAGAGVRAPYSPITPDAAAAAGVIEPSSPITPDAAAAAAGVIEPSSPITPDAAAAAGVIEPSSPITPDAAAAGVIEPYSPITPDAAAAAAAAGVIEPYSPITPEAAAGAGVIEPYSPITPDDGKLVPFHQQLDVLVSMTVSAALFNDSPMSEQSGVGTDGQRSAQQAAVGLVMPVWPVTSLWQAAALHGTDGVQDVPRPNMAASATGPAALTPAATAASNRTGSDQNLSAAHAGSGAASSTSVAVAGPVPSSGPSGVVPLQATGGTAHPTAAAVQSQGMQGPSSHTSDSRAAATGAQRPAGGAPTGAGNMPAAAGGAPTGAGDVSAAAAGTGGDVDDDELFVAGAFQVTKGLRQGQWRVWAPFRTLTGGVQLLDFGWYRSKVHATIVHDCAALGVPNAELLRPAQLYNTTQVSQLVVWCVSKLSLPADLWNAMVYGARQTAAQRGARVWRQGERHWPFPSPISDFMQPEFQEQQWSCLVACNSVRQQLIDKKNGSTSPNGGSTPVLDILAMPASPATTAVQPSGSQAAGTAAAGAAVAATFTMGTSAASAAAASTSRRAHSRPPGIGGSTAGNAAVGALAVASTGQDTQVADAWGPFLQFLMYPDPFPMFTGIIPASVPQVQPAQPTALQPHWESGAHVVTAGNPASGASLATHPPTTATGCVGQPGVHIVGYQFGVPHHDNTHSLTVGPGAAASAPGGTSGHTHALGSGAGVLWPSAASTGTPAALQAPQLLLPQAPHNTGAHATISTGLHAATPAPSLVTATAAANLARSPAAAPGGGTSAAN